MFNKMVRPRDMNCFEFFFFKLAMCLEEVNEAFVHQS